MLVDFDNLFQKYNIRPNGICHLGSSDDAREVPYYNRYCTGPVIWIEALKKVANRMAAKVAQYPNHKVLCACLGDVDGREVEFKVANNAGQSSSIMEFGTHTVEHPSVQFIHRVPMQTIRVDTLLAREIGTPYKPGYINTLKLDGPWFANIDLQGAELMALKGMQTLLPAFSWLYIEVNKRPLYQGCPMVGELDAFLAPHGFERVETWWFMQPDGTDAGWGDGFWKRRES